MKRDSDKTTHFGYRDVPVEAKQELVGGVFTSVADRYDLMNDVMSLGIHRLWKRHFVATSRVRAGDRVLDLAGGTGDIAALLGPRVGARGSVTVADINPAMLSRGRDRLLDRGQACDFVQADAEALPFRNSSFDAITIAFGLRNLTDIPRALSDAHRVLAPGGRMLILEFSELRAAALRPVYDWYSFKVLPALGRLVARDEASYRYLAESIRRHPNQQELLELMRAAGFVDCGHRNLTGGVVAIHHGVKA